MIDRDHGLPISRQAQVLASPWRSSITFPGRSRTMILR